MTRDELIKKLADLEWEDFEVKSAKAELPKDTWETVSAFCNTSGGWLVFGVKQEGKAFDIQGVSNPEKIEQDFLNTIRGGKFNIFVPTNQSRQIIDGNTVLAFYIPASKEKPVYYNSLQNTFIRRGSSDQRATREEIDAMFRDQTFGTKTSEIAVGTSRYDINNSSLSSYRDYMSRFNPTVGYNRYSEAEFLQKLRIMEGDHCTLGGLLFLGKRGTIERFFPDFRIDLLEIPGTSYTDAKVRYTYRLDEYDNLWEYYFECAARLKSKVDVEYYLGSEGFALDLSPGFDALREALVNMLMHTDHFSPGCPRIRIFTDHIEFFNPGGMPKPIDELKGKDISLPRNPIITKLFRVVKLAENAGYGLDNMDFNWKKYNQTEPLFDVSFDSVIVKFQLYQSKIRLNEKRDVDFKTEKNLLEELQKNFGPIKEKLLMSPEENIASLNGLYNAFIDYLQKNNVKTLENLRKTYGETFNEHRQRNDEKKVLMLMLITIDNFILSENIASLLGISLSTVKRYLKELKDMGFIERNGGKKVGFWRLTLK